MAKGDALGEFEYLVLLAIVRLREDAYGMRVRREIDDRTGRDTSIGAVYATLERLESKGLIRGTVSAPTHERGGRAKRSFEITHAGVAAINRTSKDFASMLDGLVLPSERGMR